MALILVLVKYQNMAQLSHILIDFIPYLWCSFLHEIVKPKYYFNPAQFVAGVSPADRASAIVLNQTLFSSLIFDTPEHQG